MLAALLALLYCERAGRWLDGRTGGMASVPDPGRRDDDHGDHEHEHHEPSFSLDVDHLASHPGLFFFEILTVVVLSLLFETWEHWVHHRIESADDKTAEKILAAIFKELTCLGFIGLTLFSATRMGLVGFCANAVRETDEHVLLETFETVHMIIFLLLIVLIFQAVAMLHVSHNVVCDWNAFEHMRAFGKYRTSLESMFVNAGHLERVPNASAPRGFDLARQRSFTYGHTFLERLKKRHDYLHSLVTWRSIRHEFLFPSDGSTSAVENPALFSYSAYLRCCMTEVVLSLVELDKRVWCMTLLLPGPMVYYATSMTLHSWLAVLCFFAWGLFCVALVLTVALEEDLHGLMPAHSLPEDPRQILVFFQGTSTSEMLQDIQESDLEMAAVKRGAPGFRSMRDFSPTSLAKRPFLLPPEVYKELLRILAFWQAICITALGTTFIAHRPKQWSQAALYFVTLVEWPLMLFFVVPVLIRRLTVRISHEVDEGLVRSITLDCKEALLRHHLRLVQFEGFYDRAAKVGQPWAFRGDDPRGSSWSLTDAARQLKQGQRTFHALPASAQDEIGSLFSVLDLNNDGKVYLPDLAQFFATMGYKEKGCQAAESLVRLVDTDGTGVLSEERFQAVVALATVARPGHELKEDVETFFDLIDKERSGKVHTHQITQRLQATKLGADLLDEDVASLLYDHFGRAKAGIGREEFVGWFQAMGSHWQHSHEREHGHAGRPH